MLKPREHSLPFVKKDHHNYPAFVITYAKQIPNPSFLYGRNSKIIVGNNSFLCWFPLIPQARTRVFGKSAVHIAHLIECAVEIDLSAFYKHASRALFVCNRCYKWVLCFEKAKTNLRSLQEEIKEDFKEQIE